MLGYFIYSLFVLAGFIIWGLLFWCMQKADVESRRKIGRFFIGPLHEYLEKRHYQLTNRELFGWGAVLLAMLLAPIATTLLEQ